MEKITQHSGANENIDLDMPILSETNLVELPTDIKN